MAVLLAGLYLVLNYDLLLKMYPPRLRLKELSIVLPERKSDDDQLPPWVSVNDSSSLDQVYAWF